MFTYFKLQARDLRGDIQDVNLPASIRDGVQNDIISSDF